MDSSNTGLHSSSMNSDGNTHKRKLSGSAEDRPNGPPPPPPAPANASSGVIGQINYLTKSCSDRLKLIVGDSDTFQDVLESIDAYEAVLNRQESIAANLGAKLVGPLLLKGLEKLFDGPITVVETSYTMQNSPVTWLEIVLYARGNPGRFALAEHKPDSRSCRINIKGGQVEICEDDYRLIASGAPEKMIPTTAIPDDEATEMGTLNILEQRLTMLIKRADTVASKARQLNYHLKGRKSAISSHKTTEQSTGTESDAQAFPAVNARSSQPPTTETTRLQAQLFDHYTALDRRSSLPQIRPKTAGNGHDSDPRRSSQTPSASSDLNRSIMSRKIEKLSTGDIIDPPCDRCRRIGQDCVKNMTACQGCTRKHAKCNWNNVQEGELNGGQVMTKPKQESTPVPQPPAAVENSGAATENGGKHRVEISSAGNLYGGNFNGGSFPNPPNPWDRVSVQGRAREEFVSPESSPDLFAEAPLGRGRGRGGVLNRSSPDLFAEGPLGRGRGRGGASTRSSPDLFNDSPIVRGRGLHQSSFSIQGAARSEESIKTSQDEKFLAKIATEAATAGRS